MKREIRNLELCPCNSSKKYKYCCKKKAFKFLQDENQQIYQLIPFNNIPDKLEPVMKLVGITTPQELWAKYFGVNISLIKDANAIEIPYKPTPKDVFVPEMLDDIEIMKQVKTPRELIYAYQKTGLMVTDFNKKWIPDKELQEFYDAANEYLEKFNRRRTE